MLNFPKNRASVISSILMNPSLLEEVYNSSLNNSANSAQRELNIYLESIDAKLAKLQNRLQQLAAISIDSDWIKTFLDGATALVTVFSNLVEKGGSLKLVLSGAVAAIAQITSNGLFNSGQGRVPFFSGLKDFFKGEDAQKIAQQYSDIFVKYGEQFKTLKPEEMDDFFDKMEESAPIVEDFVRDQNQLNKEFSAFQGWIEKSSYAVSKFSKIMSAGVNILKNVAGTLVSMAVMWVAMKGLEALGTLIYEKVINPLGVAIEKGKKASEAIDQVFENLQAKQNSIKDIAIGLNIENLDDKNVNEQIEAIAEEYSRLAKGVDIKTNANLTLTTEDYNKYLQTVSKIADMNPELIKGYDDQGNAILTLGNNAEDATEKLKGMYDMSQLQAQVEIGNNFSASIEGIIAQIKKYQSEISGLNGEIEDVKESIGFGENIFNGAYINEKIGSFELTGYTYELESAIRDAVSEVYGSGITTIISPDNNSFQFVIEGYEEDEKKLEDFMKKVQGFGGKMADEARNEMEQLNSELRLNQNYLNDQQKQIEHNVSVYLKARDSFTSINQNIQDAILDNLNVHKFAEMDPDDIELYIYQNIINPLTNLTPEVQKKIADLFEPDLSNMNLSQYRMNIISILEEAFPEDYMKQYANLGFKNIFNEYQSQQESVISTLQSTIGRTLTLEETSEILGFSLEDLKKAFELIRANVYEQIEDFQRDMTKEIPIEKTTFSSIFKSTEEAEDGIIKTTDAIQDLNKEIQGYIDTISSGESVSISDIVQAHPQELTAYSDSIEHLFEGLTKLRTDKLSTYVSQLRKTIMDNLGKNPDPDEVAQAENYIKALISEIDIEDINVDNLISNIFDSIAGLADGSVSGFYSSRAKYITEELAKIIGDDELTIQAVAKLSLDETSATWSIEKWQQEIENMKFLLKPAWDKKEFEKLNAEIEAGIAEAQARATSASSRRSYLNNQGIYSHDKGLIEQEIQARKDEIDYINQQIEGYINGTNPESYLYKSHQKGVTKEQLTAAKNAENQALSDLRNQKFTLNVEIYGLEEDKINLPLTVLENKLSLLQDEASSLQKVMSDDSKPVGVDTYKEAIDNATHQLNLLRKEQELYEEKLNDPTLEHTGQKYVEYNSKLSNVKSTINDLIKSQREWNAAINNIPIDNANRRLDVLKSNLEQINSEISLKEAQGLDKTAEDYANINANLEEQIQEQETIIETAYENIADALSMDDLFSGKLQLDTKKAIRETKPGMAVKLPAEIDFSTVKDQVDKKNNAKKEKIEAEIEITNNKNEESESELTKIQNRMQIIEAEGERLGRVLSDATHKATVDDYVNSIANAEDKIANLQEQQEYWAGKLGELKQLAAENGVNFMDLPNYTTYMSNLESIQSQLDGLADSQREWQKAIDEFDVTEINRELQHYSEQLEILQQEISEKEASGINKTMTDYKKEDALLRKQIIDNQAILDQLTTQYAKDLGTKFQAGSKADEDAKAAIKSYRDAINSANNTLASNSMAELMLPSEEIERKITGIKNSAEDVTKAIAELNEFGLSGTREQYEEAMIYIGKEYDLRQEKIEELRKVLDQMEKNYVDAGIAQEDFTKNEQYNNLISQINEAEAAQSELNQTFLEYKMMLEGGLELESLNRQLAALKQTQTALEAYRNYTTNNKQYYGQNDLKDLRDNAQSQLNIIEKQNEALRNQQKYAGDNLTKYNEINDTLTSNMQTILELSSTIEQYDKALQHHYSLQAQGISDAIKTALSESLSDGVTEDSMEALISSFTELKTISKDIDLSSMFYRSADGIRVSANQLARFVELQRKVSQAGLANQMSKLNAQLKTQQNIYKVLSKQVDNDGRTKRNAAKQNLENLRAEIKAIGLEVQAYDQAQKEIEESMSGFSKWQAALQTPNGRNKYDTLLNEFANLEKLRDAGLIGTDDFKTAIEMLTKENRTTTQAFDDIYPWMTEYFRPDHTGLLNFMEDLTELGLAESNGGFFTLKTTDLDQMSDALGNLWGGPQTRIDVEVLQMFMEALKDYGFEVVSVMDAVDAQAQQVETTQNLIEAIKKKASGEQRGFSGITLSEYQEDIDKLTDRYRILEQEAEDYANQPLISEEAYREDMAGIQALLDYANTNITDPMMLQYFYDEAKDMADRLGAEIIESADGVFLSVEGSYDQTLTHMREAIASKLLDLRNRPKLGLQDLVNAGYDVGQIENEDDLVTLYSHTFSNEEGTAAVTLTPILPNGEVISPEALEDYANQILAGAIDVDGLVLGTYSIDEGWSDPIDQAEKLGDALHRVSAIYESNDEEAKQMLNNLRGYSTEFLKTIDLSTDYSTISNIPQETVAAQEAIIQLGELLGYSRDEALSMGAAIIDAMDKFGLTADSFDAEFVVRTRIEESANQSSRVQFWKDLIEKGDDETLARELDLDLNVQADREKFEEEKEYIANELNASDFALGIKIDQDQFNTLIQKLEEGFTNGMQSAIDNAAKKVSLYSLEEKFRRLGMSEEQISKRLNQIGSDDKFSGVIVDDRQKNYQSDVTFYTKKSEDFDEQVDKIIKEVQDQKVEFTTTYTFDDDRCKENALAALSLLRDAVKDKNITIEISVGEEDIKDVESKIDEIFEYKKEERDIVIKVTAEEDPSLEEVKTKIEDIIKLAANPITVDVGVTGETMTQIEAAETALITLQNTANAGASFQITGDDPTQLVNAITYISENDDLTIYINGEPTNVNKALEYVEEHDGETITFEIVPDEDSVTDTNQLIEDIKTTNPELQVFANNDEAIGKIDETEEYVGEKNPKMKVGADTEELKTGVDIEAGNIETREAIKAPVGANLDPLNGALVEKQNEMNINPLIQPVQAQVTYTEPIGPSVGGGFGGGGGSSWASGTLSAYANGTNVKNGAIAHDEYAVVNELNGHEGLIRDGQLREIPGGMHVEKLKKGDVILNTRQMDQLKKSGKASGNARIVGGQSSLPAFASGIDLANNPFIAAMNEKLAEIITQKLAELVSLKLFGRDENGELIVQIPDLAEARQIVDTAESTVNNGQDVLAQFTRVITDHLGLTTPEPKTQSTEPDHNILLEAMAYATNQTIGNELVKYIGQIEEVISVGVQNTNQKFDELKQKDPNVEPLYEINNIFDLIAAFIDSHLHPLDNTLTVEGNADELLDVVNKIEDHPNLKVYFETDGNMTGLKETLDELQEYENKEDIHFGFVVYPEDEDAKVSLANLKSDLEELQTNDHSIIMTGNADQAEAAYNAFVGKVTTPLNIPMTATISGGLVGGGGASWATGTLNSYSSGRSNVRNGKITHDEDALVNELGTEGLIRDGRLTTIPGGMHIEHLRHGDIILSAEQMEDLIKYGRADGVGKLIGNSVYATGTLYNGIPSYASASASGFFNPTPGLHHFFQDLENAVDDLDDYSDSAKDAGDAAKDAADDTGNAADNLTNAFDDLVDQVQYSFQTIDLVQRRLQYFSNQTKKIADQMTEYIDTTTKRDLIGKQMEAISQELYANSRAATTYRDYAIEEALNHKYYAIDRVAEKNLQYGIADYKNAINALGGDTNNDYYRWLQGELNNLEHQLKVVQSTQLEYTVSLIDAGIDLDELRNGAYRLDQIDTSTDYGKALYEAAQQYLQLTDNAQNAADQIQTLSNQLRSLYSDMIQLPFEDLEKAISKLENTMSTISSFITTMDSRSGIQQLEQLLTGTFGQSKTREIIGNYTRTFDALNYQIDQNLQKQHELLNQNDRAYEETLRTARDLEQQSKVAQDALDLRKYWLKDLNLPDIYMNMVENNEALDASLFGVRPDLIAEYNQKLAEYKAVTDAATEANEKAEEQFEKTKQSASEFAAELVNSVFKKLENINNYFKSFSDWEATIANHLQTTRDYVIKTGTYLENGTQIAQSYTNEMQRYSKQAEYLMDNATRQRQELQEAVNAGRIIVGDEKYKEAMTNIIALENEYVEAKSKIVDLNQEIANIPVQQAEEKLEQIQRKYQSIISMANNVSTRGQQKVYSQLATQMGNQNYSASTMAYGNIYSKLTKGAKEEAWDNRSNFNKTKTYSGANAYLETELERMQEETKVSNELLIKLGAQADKAKDNYNEYKKIVEEYAWSNLGAVTQMRDSTLSQRGWDAINNMTRIDVSDLDPSRYKAAENIINYWNKMIDNLEAKSAQMKTTADLYEQEKVNNQQYLNDLASSFANLYPQEFENIGNYYRSLYENNEKLASTYQKVRDTMEELGRSMDGNGNLITDTTTLSKNYQQQLDNLQKTYDNMKTSLNEQAKMLANIKKALGEDSEEYRTSQNALYDLQNSMNDVIIEMDKLRDESREVLYFKPIEEYIDRLNKLRDNLSELTDMFSEDQYFTIDGEYTQFGLAAAESAMSGYTRSLQAIAKIEEEFNENEKRYREDMTYSDEEYLEKREQITDAMRKEVQDANSYRNKIKSIYESRYRQELNYLQEIIKARQEALQKQKEMYDYDKQLRNKTKDIQLLEQQARALENINDLEARSQKQRIEAQLNEARDDLNETVKQHVYDLRIEGLSNLSQELEDNFDKIVKDLQINTDTVVKTINDLSSGLGGYINETNAFLNQWLKTYLPTLDKNMIGVEGLTAENTSNIPNKDLLQQAAESMVHYYNNYSSAEAEKIGIVNGAVKEETDKIANAIRDYSVDKSKINAAADEIFTTADIGEETLFIIKDGFEGIISELPKKTADALSVNLKEIIAAVKPEVTAEDVASLNNSFSSSNKVTGTVNTPVNYNSDVVGGHNYLFSSSNNGGTTRSSSANVIENIIDGGTISNTSSNTQILDKIANLVLKNFKSALRFQKVADAEDALVDRISFVANKNATSSQREIISQWNANRFSFTEDQIKQALNSIINSGKLKGKANYKRYAKGTLNAARGLAQIFEEGPEIITTKAGTFMPFSGGEGVIPADATKGLMDLGVAMSSGNLAKQTNQVVDAVDDGFNNLNKSMANTTTAIRQVSPAIGDMENEFSEMLQEQIETAQSNMEAMIEKVDSAATDIANKVNESSKYVGVSIMTSYGELVPLTNRLDMFSSSPDDKYLDIVKSTIPDMVRSFMDEMNNVNLFTSEFAEPSTVTIGSLVTVNGNADSTTVDQIRQIASDLTKNKKFLNNVVTYVNTEQAKDLRKSGRARN